MEFRRWGILLLALSILFSFVAAYLFLNMVQGVEKNLGENVKVVVAKENVPAFSPLGREQIGFIDIPRKYVLDCYFRQPAEVEGKVLLVPVQKGEVITRSMVREVEKLPANVRVVQLRPPVVFDAGKLKPGDRVDIIGTYVQDRQTVTETILSGVSVHEVVQDEKTGGYKSVAVAVEKQAAINLINWLNKAKEIRVLRENFYRAQ